MRRLLVSAVMISTLVAVSGVGAATTATTGSWVGSYTLGGADEQKPAAAGTVEAWARAADNPVGGWYGLKKGLRGRFGVYLPPLLEALGLAELTHEKRNNQMRAR